ncbi:MAG TPA: sugar transferase [Tepidisphaeraceae bacterium]|jgi:lipopolysaccharide/colanic/teichoic acid biosynthesis glycosyltransferase|nr:sugar transferase [Tepidisphaeraceae bacterium]
MRLDVAGVAEAPRALAPAAPEMRRLHHLYSPEQISFVLQRERARADRHSREFSLVIFRTESDLRPALALSQLAKIVLAHARATDEVGHYDKTSVCVVLPDTDATGSWKFAQRVCDSAKRQDLMPICVVYTYPSAWFPKEKNNHDHHNGNGSNGNGHNGHGHNGHHQGNRRRVMVPMDFGTSMEFPPTEIPVQRMEALLAKPMPWWKRTLDLMGAGMALLVFSPIMLVIALAIKLTSPGPVIFKQKRAGLGGKPFEIYKFRSMCTDAEEKKKDLMGQNEQDGPAFKIKSDPRITRIGKLIRSTSLDELPQLLNVMRGEMSLVGPRPLPVDEADAADQWQQRRLEVTPGLTCIWQIKGRSRVTFDEWVRMDINYIRRRNIGHDISLLLQTIPAVLLRRGAR